MNNKILNSYTKHKNHLVTAIKEGTKFDYNWLENKTYDSWRHQRMYRMVDVLINKKDSWLTIGDGRYGSDAHYLIKNGVKNVIASDISNKQLKIASKEKFINKFKEINAEQINLKDDGVDCVFCKESFHHFPRPVLALYEMIRVARKAVVLIEPNDTKAMVNQKYENSFEAVGNYKYPISIRETEKITNSIGLYGIAYKGIDDVYLTDGGRIRFDSVNVRVIFAKFKLFVMNLLETLKIRDNSLVCLVIFKSKPSSRLYNSMVNFGFNFIINKQNPYA